MQYRFTKRDFKTYLKYVRRPAKQCAGGGCVLAQFVERIGGRRVHVSSFDARAYLDGDYTTWFLPDWAQAVVRAFDTMTASRRGWVKAKDYKRVLSAI